MSEAKRDFSKEAASWDEEPRRVALARELADAIRSEVKLTPDVDVLDFGCGTGLVSLQLQPFVRSVTCIDSAQGMLDVVNAKVNALGVSNVTTQLVDLDAGDTLTGSYSLVVSTMTFHHIRDIAALLSQFAESTRPGGRICVADLDLEGGRFHGDNTGVHHFGFDRAVLQNLFVEAGFEEVRDTTAAEVLKPDADGKLGSFSVFLLSGKRT